jgi:uncharacterized protein (DUF1684 family)
MPRPNFSASPFLALAFSVGIVAATSLLQADDRYVRALTAWRQEREAALKADNGWLTVAGLFFLNQGKNTFGSGPLNDIVLPSSAPAEAGVFDFDGKKVVMRARAALAVNGKDTTEAELRPAAGDQPADQLTIGPLTLFVHLSGDRLAIRLRDKNSDIRRNFTGLKWFSPNEAYKVTARFEPYTLAKTVKVPNILGDLETYTAPGVVAFTLNGQEHKLEAFESGSGDRKRFFLVFRDLTSGKETYPSARFLYADLPVNGETTLDFNKAYNPPCAFNPYTTCPLPSEQNRLRVRIEAGELDYHKAATH